MASILRRKTGGVAIQFLDISGKRRTLGLGNAPERFVKRAAEVVDDLLDAARYDQPAPAGVTAWLDGLNDEQYARFVAAGLVIAREKRRPERLADFLDAYITSRGDVKPRTRINLDQARKKLVAYFGGKTRLDEITLADAVRYARWLESPDGGGLSPNTARRLLGRSKQMFAVAVDDELLAKNVFKQKGLRCTVTGNRDRMHFVTEEVAHKVLEACPTLEWKLIFSLARWGGLRTPSETLALRWGDMRWDIGRIRVPVPKLEHHEGHGERWLPMFPELRGLLEQAYDAAEPGTEFVISRTRNSGVNFRTQLLRIITAAGVSPWEKLFQNLRSTRATELSERYPSHVVAAWLGHSVEVGAKHYMQVTDDHFESALQSALHFDLELAEIGGNRGREKTKKPAFLRVSRVNQCPHKGPNNPDETPEKQGVIPSRAAIGAAVGAETGQNPAESPDLLARLEAAWNRLSDADRAEVVGLAERLAGALDAMAGPVSHSGNRTACLPSELSSAP